MKRLSILFMVLLLACSASLPLCSEEKPVEEMTEEELLNLVMTILEESENELKQKTIELNELNKQLENYKKEENRNNWDYAILGGSIGLIFGIVTASLVSIFN